jgi:hypothetical protein
MIWASRTAIRMPDRVQQGAVDNGTPCALARSVAMVPVGVGFLVAAVRPNGTQ